MGALPGWLGIGGGQAGSGVPAPEMPGLTTVATPDQLARADSGVQNSLGSQQALLQALQQQNGLGRQDQVYGQLQQVASGSGPNPAQAQYHQNINQLAAQQAGLMGSQKGMSPALQAMLVGQQGSSAMQNAAGQGAANLANQQLNAMNAAGAMATTQAGQQIGQVNQNNLSQQAAQAALLNAATGQNNAMVGAQGNVNSANAQIEGGVQQNQGKLIGGALNAAGLGGAKGATPAPVPAGANGGEVITNPGPAIVGPQSRLGQFMAGVSPGAASFAQGGQVPALVSPGELWLPPEKVNEVAAGANPLKAGERIPGTPKVPGNSYANDTVSKNLAVGGVVIPNNIMQSKNPAKGASDFVAKIIAKRKATG